MYIFQRLILYSLLFFTHISYAQNQFEVLILHSYSQEYPWTKNQHYAFISQLRLAGMDKIGIKTEHLDTKRKRFDAEYIRFFYTYLKTKYQDYVPDVIYVTDDNALNFSLEHFHTLFPQSPVVFSGVNNLEIRQRLDRTRITGVFEKKDISRNLELLGYLDPYVKDILVVGDGSYTYHAIEKELKQQLAQHTDISARYIAENTMDELLAEITKASSKYIFLTTLGGMKDANGNTLALKEILSQISETGKHIIISMEDAYVSNGILGGYVTSGAQQGKYAAKLVIDYHSGIEFKDLAIYSDSPNEYMFNFPVMYNMGLVLPEKILIQANIINKPPSFFDRYSHFIISLIIGLTVVLFFILILFLMVLAYKNREIQSNSIQTQELEQIIFDRTMQLSDEKRKLIQAQNIAHIGNYAWELENNKTTWSDELYEIVGHSPEDFKPSYESYVNCIHPDDREHFINLTQMVLKAKNKYSSEYRIARPDGDIRYVYEQGEVKTDNHGKLIGLVGVIHDITERKNSEDEFMRLQRELSQARKMEALGQLTGGIAHDFNNILAIISGYTDLILENSTKVDPKILDYLQNISQAANRASDLVSKMMVFSRSDTGVSEPLAFAPLVEESIKMLRSLIPSSITINYQLEDNLPKVMMDPIQLHQIMMNLAINAKDAMNGSGDLTINLGWSHMRSGECNACHKQVNGNWVELRVTDTGHGMTADVVERIFEPFYTTKKVGQGTGMGLSVLNAIVESHGGHILIDTKVNAGTTFHVLFPAAHENEIVEHADFTDTLRVEHAGNGQKILVVDDEASITEYLCEILRNHGYDCTGCSHSPEALSLIENKPDYYDLVITDQTMPQLLGTEMINRIWEINPELPVILTTGYSDMINREQAETMGIHYMDKPINNSQLLALIDELLNRTA